MYCWATSALFFVICTANFVLKAYTVEVTYVSIGYLLMLPLCITTLCHYRVKFFKHQDEYNSILENMDRIDDLLESAEVNIPYFKYQLVFITYSTLAIVIHIYAIIKFYWKDKPKLMDKGNVIVDVNTLYAHTVNAILLLCIHQLSLQIKHVLIIIYQKLCCIRYAVQDVGKLGIRNCA